MRPACVCSRYCFQSLSNFCKSSFECFHLMKQSQRKHPEQGFQSHLGTSRQAKVPAWTLESVLAFYILHFFRTPTPEPGEDMGWAQPDFRGTTYKWALSLARRCSWGARVLGPCRFPCGGKGSSASYKAPGCGTRQ